ncbi:MAG: hypothetical protein ABEN55_15175, partial [Bradymonadaceae bacterium]
MTDESEQNDEASGDDEQTAGRETDEHERSRDEAAGRAALAAEFGGGGGEDEEIDPELMALAEERSRPSALRPILFVAVIALSIWIVADFQTELEYFFSSSEPVAVGDIAAMAQKPGEDPNWSEKFPHNQYVSLSGIPKRRSQSKKYRYFKLTGAPVYVEQPLSQVEDTSKFKGPTRPGNSASDRTYFESKGRMIAFGKAPDKYNGVKSYYRKNYGTRFCENLDEDDKARIRNEQRSAIIDNWRERYDNASEQERKEKGLTPKPTEQEIKEIMNA